MKHDITLEVRSSLIHGGEVLGVGKYLHRENFLLPDGSIENIPVVSGNALRGALRDVAAQMFEEALDGSALPLPVSHALWSGGAVSKARGIPLSGEKLRTVRAACPPLALFGWASAGRIISGSLSVGKMVLVCSELAHLLPASISTDKLRSYWDLTQLEEFSHFPDTEEITDESSILMRYAAESFIPGARFSTWYAASTRTPTEELFLNALMRKLASGEVAIGGHKNRGHGIVAASNLLSTADEDNDWKEALFSEFSVEEVVALLEEHIR